MNIAIFVSGRGSNMEALIKASQNSEIDAKISLVLSNNPEAKALDFAKENNIDTICLNHKEFNSRLEFDLAMLDAIKKHPIDLICLAGFMRLLTKEFLDNLPCPIINIHPSLLPNFKGANAVEDAYNARAKISGCTVHYVTEEMDAGEIITQREVLIDYNESLEQLKNKILTQEHIAYIDAVKKLQKTV